MQRYTAVHHVVAMNHLPAPHGVSGIFEHDLTILNLERSIINM